MRRAPIWPEPGAGEALRPLNWPLPSESRWLRARGVPRLRMIAEGCLYASGQPSHSAYVALRSSRLRAVVNLRAESRLYDWKPENGMHALPLRREQPPTFEQAERFLRIAGNRESWPLLLHSGAGDGRASTLVALVRYAFDGWDLEDCLREAARHRRFRLLVWLGWRSRLGGAQEQFLRQWALAHEPGSHRPQRNEEIEFCGECPHREEITALWNALPEKVRRVAIQVEEKTAAEWGYPNWAGQYDDGLIRLCLDFWSARLFYHEYGHALWHDAMTGDRRRDWERFWERNLESMPRDYARTNAQEGFCDCFVLAISPVPPKGYRPLPRSVRERIRRYFDA